MDARKFEQETRRAAERVGRLTEAGVNEARQLLEQMRNELILKLAGTPTDYSEWYYTKLLEDVDRLTEDLRVRYEDGLNRVLDGAAEEVNDLIDRAGLTLDLPRASRQSVEMLSGFSPGKLIGGLTEAARVKIANELRLGMLGVKTPWEVQQALAKSLTEPGPFGSIHARAEAIWVTEASRVFNTLAEERYKRVAQNFPDRFLKKWNHSGNTRHPRPHHVALGQQPPIKVEEKFLVGSYAADGPHDPVLPASEVIRCGCYLTMVENPNWKRPETPVAPPTPPPEPAIPANWEAAATIQDIERLSAAKFPNMKTEFEGLDPQVMRETMQEYERLAQEFPQVAEKIKYIGSHQKGSPVHKNYNWGGTVWAHAGKRGLDEWYYIGLNPQKYGNLNLFTSEIKKGVATMFHPPSCNDIASVIAHEFGHHVSNYFDISNMSISPQGRMTMDGSGSSRVLTQQWKNFAFRSMKKDKTGDWDLSDYARANGEEAWAEGFAALQKDDLSSRYVRQQKALIDVLKPAIESKWYAEPGRESREIVEWHEKTLKDIKKIK